MYVSFFLFLYRNPLNTWPTAWATKILFYPFLLLFKSLLIIKGLYVTIKKQCNHKDNKMTNEQKQKQSLGVIWRCFNFNKSDIATACGVNRQTVYHWFRRGRISATAAIKLENHEKVKGVITKEEMRPDVNEWFGV